ncbi:MAG TPA: hypothetical protein PLE73_05975 [Spirochaetota bacterium]|nr:hypothetical protein [Spirochaetota bacterium]HPI22725.1 hypothetical protein [Spirochaetota bacterium]HPU87306.1 hypothetical protein [Spirochaetota bacterium]
MAAYQTKFSSTERPSTDFFDYWDSLGFFDNLQVVLPPQFFAIFEIARVIFTEEMVSEALTAIEDITKKEMLPTPDRDVSIMVNRMERTSPLSDNMEIDNFQTIYQLRKTLPRELAWDDDIFNMKLLTKSLLVQKFYESETDRFKPVSTRRDESGREANRFEQKFFLLLDRSKSMDMRMRSFYSKSIVAEFLRRKINSNAKIFYRPFDSKPGELFKLEKKEDFPLLIERVLLTTTGGTSTNLQAAVCQAASDINYDKDMANAEILVVTDGISKINKFELRERLGDIKLNILKVGRDLAEPDFYGVKGAMENVRIDTDFTAYNIQEVNQKMARAQLDEESLSPREKRAYGFMLEYSDSIITDLKYISNRFIEIGDLEPTELFKLDDDILDFIEMTTAQLAQLDLSERSVEDLKVIYKKAYFLGQYIELLMEYGGNIANPVLKKAQQALQEARQKMLNDPVLYELVTRAGNFREDKKMLKMSRKEARKRMKEMKLEERALSSKEMKQAQLILTMDTGTSEGGSMGQLIKLLVIKLVQGIVFVVKKIAGARTAPTDSGGSEPPRQQEKGRKAS